MLWPAPTKARQLSLQCGYFMALDLSLLYELPPDPTGRCDDQYLHGNQSFEFQVSLEPVQNQGETRNCKLETALI